MMTKQRKSSSDLQGIRYQAQGTQLTPKVIKEDVITSCVDGDTVICNSVQTVHISAHKSLAVIKTNVDLDSHADTCVVGDHC